MYTEPVEEAISAQLKTLDQEKKNLEKALALVQGKKAASSKSSPAPAKRGRPGKSSPSGKKKPAAKSAVKGGSRADQVLTYLSKNPGSTATEVSKGIGVSGPHAHQILSRLKTNKAAKKSGKTYSAA